MGAADAANWATIIATSLTGLVALCGVIFWLTVIYLNGRATRRSCAKLERQLRAQANYLRKHARKSENFHETTAIRLENHEMRLQAVEHGGPAE